MATTREAVGDAPFTLWRVGTPSIGETYGRRWNWTRDSGALGTGVYAFFSEDAADRNTIVTGQPDANIYELTNALENPVELTDRDAVRGFVRTFQKCDRVRSMVNDKMITWAKAVERGGDLSVSLNKRRSGQEIFEMGGQIRRDAWDALMGSPQLRDRWGLEPHDFVQDALRATSQAAKRIGHNPRRDVAVQPANKLLWHEFDGVLPHPGAGGNEGKFGCLVFKERIDNCVGHGTVANEEIDAETLRRCWR